MLGTDVTMSLVHASSFPNLSGKYTKTPKLAPNTAQLKGRAVMRILVVKEIAKPLTPARSVKGQSALLWLTREFINLIQYIIAVI